MAVFCKSLCELYRQTQQRVTDPAQWQAFLTTACRNYRLPFDQQLLVYAQRPDAVAVLEMQRWNRQFGRWVNRGARGIAVFSDAAKGAEQLKYYFDISDTHEGPAPRPVPLWEVHPEFMPQLGQELEQRLFLSAPKSDLAGTLLLAAQRAVEEQLANYLVQLQECVQNSPLAEMNEQDVTSLYKTALQNSVSSMLLTRCGIDPALHFTENDFSWVRLFSTPSALNALGVACGDIAKPCLSEIARIVFALQEKNRTLAPTQHHRYDKTEDKPIRTERSLQNGTDHLQPTGQLLPAGPAASAAAEHTSGDIRIAAPAISETESPRPLHQPADNGQAARASGRYPADGTVPDGTDDSTDGHRRRDHRTAESQRPDAVGTADEQHPDQSTGTGSARTDLQLNSENAGAPQPEPPAFFDEAQQITVAPSFISTGQHKENPEQEQQISFLDAVPASQTVNSEAQEPESAKVELPVPTPLSAVRIYAEGPTFRALHPEIPAEQRQDFHITDNALGHGTPGEKFAANVQAVRCLKRIEQENRLATSEEQQILSGYVGWGGLADCFEERHSKYAELKNLLDAEEYATARASSLTAFYTSPVIIRGIYTALAGMGFRQGNILEPACGTGNFIGMLPPDMAGCKVYGVELDSLSGRIAQQLYQTAGIAVTGFEKAEMPDSFFDVAVGNVPFGDFRVSDKRYDKHHWLIHDYFFGATRS